MHGAVGLRCRWTDWVPTLGGRSVRPVLDRMDWALTQLLQGYEVSGRRVLKLAPATEVPSMTLLRKSVHN